jgi:hypothetical protein
VSAARLPYVDERAIEVAVPRDQEWVALRRYVAESLLTTGGGPLRRCSAQIRTPASRSRRLRRRGGLSSSAGTASRGTCWPSS